MKEKAIHDPHVQLMLSFQAGDESAFAALVDHYKARVVAIAYRFLQNQEEAEDAAQEVFLRVYRARKTYRFGPRFSSWIFTIVNRVCLNKLRHCRRHPTISLGSLVVSEDSSSERQLEDQQAENAINHLVQTEKQQMVQQAVLELSEQERMAVILDYWEDMSLEMIGEVLNKSIPAVNWNYQSVYSVELLWGKEIFRPLSLMISGQISTQLDLLTSATICWKF